MILEVNVGQKIFRGADGREKIVLADLAFALAEREILALVGPSGCGKTTLLKIIGGLDTDFRGSVDWAGGRMPRIGTVFQEPRLLPWLTVERNIELVMPAGVDRGRTEALLAALGLASFADAYPAQLSLGMARRVAIARAFAIEPEIVVLDEPFVSLDPAMAERSRGILLAAWNRRPTAALLVTHDLVEAVSLADRILMLSAAPTRAVADIAIPESIRRRGGEAATAFAAELRSAAGTGTGG